MNDEEQWKLQKETNAVATKTADLDVNEGIVKTDKLWWVPAVNGATLLRVLSER